MGNDLTKREQEILKWLIHGMSNKEIAEKESISPRTVQKHLQRIYQCLGVQTRAEAIVFIHQDGKHLHL
ncbi:protein of unknown function [Nitrospira japonica]|uniref:HTH luxR-type domain-containing protein n=1 Tax=Nitrospira japonica TaxID=1325564 RepID=A0A1W1I0F0_9BACT|nr:protein of unknown function [Nitrospira japonica]